MRLMQISDTFEISMDVSNFRYQDLCKLDV
nr:MAG TPA: hypothetical protein [Caudoviricetes sp.]